MSRKGQRITESSLLNRLRDVAERLDRLNAQIEDVLCAQFALPANNNPQKKTQEKEQSLCK